MDTWMLVIVDILVIFGSVIYIRQNKKRRIRKTVSELDFYELLSDIPGFVSEYLKTDEKVLALRKSSSVLAQRSQKESFRQALRNCTYGSEMDKKLVCDFIREYLVWQCGVNEQNIDEIIPFQNPDRLSSNDCFLLLLLHYSANKGNEALTYLILDYADAYAQGELPGEIREKEIRELYCIKVGYQLTYKEKLTYLVQKLYENYKGFDCMDLLLSQKVDGISAGVSGSAVLQENWEHMSSEKPQNINLWIFFRGISIPLYCLFFENEDRMIRVCKNIYRYQAREQLSRQKGYLISERADGARVVVARPPFAESWSFFIRKFDTVTSRKITDLFQDPYADYLELLCSALVQGEFTIAVTGGQGAGKTTMLAALIDYIPAQYNLRILETAFELNLRKIYPDRNILSFRETENISGQEALDLQKKTDGSVHILGEVATAPVASYMMQMASTASRFTMFTHHAKTTMMLVQELRNALLSTGTFRNEEAAINQVLSTLDIDIHLAQYQGKRFVESIQEIVPSEVSGQYHVNRLLEWREGQYHLCAPISQGKMEQLLARVPEKQKKELLMLWNVKM